MTKTELRILYLLRKRGGQVKRLELSQAMSRIARSDREQALASVEALELVSSARQPPPTGYERGRGTGGLVYWLTEAGNEAVDDLIERGEMKAPPP